MRLDEFQPTSLLDPDERPRVVVAPLARPGRWRLITIAVRWAGWMLSGVRARLAGAHAPAARGRRLRDLLEELGGPWVKVGQLMSLRIDLFDAEFCRELARLQDRARGFPGALARDRIETELRCPLDQVFAEFDPHPVAAASVGQVHRATLRDGRVVAVKVQRPWIEESFSRELVLVRAVFTLLTWLRIKPFVGWRKMQRELEAIFREELDYRREASSMQRMRASLAGRQMYVPHVYLQWSTARVLVMEYVSGVLMSDYITMLRDDPDRVQAWQRVNDVDSRRLVRRFSLAILRQILEDNLYHGDLHPGNVVLLRHGRVALLDFGAVGSTDREYLGRFSAMMQALAQNEHAHAADVALLMAGGLQSVDVAAARDEVVRDLLRWSRRTSVATLPYSAKSVDAVYVAITRTFYRHRITFDWAFLRIRRALATMDATAMHLDPQANYTDVILAYFKRARRRAFTQQVRAMILKGAGTLAAPGSVDGQIRSLLDLAAQIERRQLRTATRSVSSASAVLTASATVVRAVAVGVVLVGVAVLVTRTAAPWLDVAAVPLLARIVPAWDWQAWAALVLGGVAVARSARAVAAHP